jgi:hypothetical protein
MKIKQIVGEHKKGVRARKYLVKGPEPRKPVKAVDSKKTADTVDEGTEQFGKVTGVTPDGKVTIAPNDASSGGPITIDKTALLPGAQPNTVAMNPNAAGNELKPGTQVTTSTEQAVGEGAMSEIHAELSQIADAEDYDALYTLLSDNGPVGQYLQGKIEDITAETGLHPKDDFEQIEQMLMDIVQQEFGGQSDDEGGETDDNYAMASAGFGSDEDYEEGIPGNVPTEKIPGKEDLLKGRGRKYYESADDILLQKMLTIAGLK